MLHESLPAHGGLIATDTGDMDIRTTLAVSRRQATRIAEQLVALGWLEPKGERRGRHYVLVQDRG